MIPDKLALLVGPVHTRSAALFFSWATSPKYFISSFTWRGDRAHKHDWSVYSKSSNGYVQVCSLQGCSWAQLWVIVLSVKYQIIEMPPRFLLKTKLPLLINSVHQRTRGAGQNRSLSDCWRACSVKTTVHYWTGFVLPPCYWPPQCHRLLKVSVCMNHLIPPTPPRSSPCSDEEGSRHAAQCGRPVTALSRVVMLQWWKHCFSWLCLYSREPELLSPAPSLTSHPRRPLTSRWAQTRITNGNFRLKEGDFYPHKAAIS